MGRSILTEQDNSITRQSGMIRQNKVEEADG